MKLAATSVFCIGTCWSVLLTHCDGLAPQVVQPQGTPDFRELSPSNYRTETRSVNRHVMAWLFENTMPQPAFAAETSSPSKEEIQLLRNAFAAFYGTNRDPSAAEPLLSQAIQAWERQPNDERAGMYRVRGDCYMVRYIRRNSRIYILKECPLILSNSLY